MRGGLFFLLVVFGIARVGTCVGWSYEALKERFSNDFEASYKISDASTDVCSGLSTKLTLGERLYCTFKGESQKFKSSASGKVQEVLPSPHSELVMGMVLGENQFKLIPTYNDILKRVGLVHVVVVSGYNISLVFALLMRLLGSQYKIKNLVIGLFATFIYAGISGFGIPAVRAWIMGSIAVIFKFYGRPTQGIKILIFSAIVILLLAPEQLFSVSFQLSFMATLGVMLVPDALSNILARLGLKNVPGFLEDFTTSLSAQLMVNPIISYYFGTISIVSLVANPLVLWVVPVCTILGGVLVLAVFINSLLAHVLSFVMFPFLDFFVSFSEFFANFSRASVNMRFSPFAVLIYYALLFLMIRLFRKRKTKDTV